VLLHGTHCSSNLSCYFVINLDKDEASARSDRSFDHRSGHTDENAQDPNHFDPVSDSEETNCDGSQSSERSSHSSSHSKTHRRSPERRRSSSSSVLTERAIQNRENRRHQHHQETMAPGNSRRQQKTARRKSSRLNAATNSDDDDGTQTGRAILAQMKRESELKEKQHKEALAKLRAEIAELQGKRAKKSKGNRAIPVNKGLKAGFHEVAKAELWRTTKFIADDEELMDATCLVAKKIPELKKHFATEDKCEQEEYARAFVGQSRVNCSESHQ
jgi:paraquat-inducible protein B